MRSKIKVCRAIVSLGDEAPHEFRIFKNGLNEAEGGDFLFDLKSREMVAAQLLQEFSADFEHQALQRPASIAPAAAWYKLELRADGLWVVELKWTTRAEEMIKAKEYRFFSPAFEVEQTDDGLQRVSRFINFALTNLPAMKNLKPLIAANQNGVMMAMDVGSKVLIAEGVEADESLKGQIGTIVGAAEGGLLVQFEGMEEPLMYAVEQLVEAPATQEAKDPAIEEEEEEDPEEMSKAAAPVAAAPAPAVSVSPVQLKRNFNSSVLKLTHATSLNQALGIVTAWKASHAKVVQLNHQIARMEAEREEVERDAMIQKCIDEKKLAPKDDAMKAWLCSLPTESLRGYLDSAPRIGRDHKELRQDSSETTVSKLSDAERKLVASLGVSEEKFLAHRAAK